MAGINIADVRAILDAIEGEELLYCRIRTAGIDVVLSADADALEGVELRPAASGRVADVAPASARPPTVVAAPASEQPPPGAAAAVEELAGRDGLVPVSAPMLGTFYRAEKPGAPPFVEVGAAVTASTTVGLIEAMKVFTAVAAGVAGTVASIEAENGQTVEFGTTLMVVAPAGAEEGDGAS